MKEPERESFSRLTRSLKSEMTRMSGGSGGACLTPRNLGSDVDAGLFSGKNGKSLKKKKE